MIYTNSMDTNPMNKNPQIPPQQQIKKIDITQVMKLAAEAGKVIREAEKREKINELQHP